MKAANVVRSLLIIIILALGVGSMFGQNIRNKGTFINASPMSTKNFNNGKGAGAANNSGKLVNYSQITFTGGGGFFNYDSVTTPTGGVGTGTLYNYASLISGATGMIVGAHTIDVSNGQLLNDTAGTVNAGGSIQLKSPSGITVGTTPTITTAIGTFEYNGNGAQSIYTTTYGTLKLTTGGAAAVKTLGNNVTVNTGVVFTTGGGAVSLDENGKTLTLNGATSFSGSGTLTASGTNSTTIYALAGAQTVYGASYYNLQINGGSGSTKTAGGGITIVTGGSLSVAASTTLDMGTNTLTSNPVGVNTITNSGTIQTGGSVTFGSVYTIGGSFKYNGTSGQNIGSANYSSLDLSGAGGKTFPSAVGVSGAYTIQGGTGARTYTGNTFTYNSTTAQTVLGGESYNNLTMASATDTSASNYKTASGAFTVAGALTINSGNTLDMVSYSTSTFGGSSANNGKIRWSANNVYVAGAGTTELYTSAAGNIAAGSAYGNIWITGTNKTIPASTAVTATGGTASFGVTVDGSLTVAATGSLTVTSMDLINNGTITNSGSVTVQ